MTRAFLTLAFLASLLLPTAASAGELVLEGRAVQGAMMVGQTRPPARVTHDGRAVRVDPNGLFLTGFGRKAKPTSVITAVFPDGSVETRRLTIEQREYRVQRINGLPKRKVSPTKKDLERIRAERALIGAARRRFTPEPWFRAGFEWPVVGRISGVYGSQRILNGKPRRPHFGVDVAMPTGTPVAAAADGIITLAHPDMFFTGGTLIIDHGFGLNSVYMHLSEIHVKKGDRVRRGMRVAAVGATGRVTGPHLHWQVNLSRTRLDPALLVGPMPKPKPTE